MTQRLNLAFIQQPLFSLYSWTGLGVLILIVSLIVATVTWQSYQDSQTIYQEITAKLNLHNHYKKNVAKVVVINIPTEKIKEVQEAVNLLIIPWSSLLLNIEQSNIPDIALLGLEPSIKKQQVLVTGQAKNLETVFSYVKQLETQPVLSQVYLQKHSIDEADVSKPVNFTILAKWQMSQEKHSHE